MIRHFSPTSILILAVAIATFCCAADQAQAQLLPVFKALKTRRFEPPYQYSPTDPWTRSDAIQVQTKHYGYFYNCDDEECKRNSPYIKWENHLETDLSEKRNCFYLLKSNIDEIKQRISDGGCGCGQPGCDCQ